MNRDLKTISILFRAKNTLEVKIKEDVLKYGLNTTEFGALEALYHKGQLSVQNIVNKVLIANSSMSYVLENLKKKGYVQSISDENDRRVQLVSLTEQGKGLMENVFFNHFKNMRKLLDVLTIEEEKILQELLKKIGKQ